MAGRYLPAKQAIYDKQPLNAVICAGLGALHHNFGTKICRPG
jgi:hypothetical protein